MEFQFSRLFASTAYYVDRAFKQLRIKLSLKAQNSKIRESFPLYDMCSGQSGTVVGNPLMLTWMNYCVCTTDCNSICLCTNVRVGLVFTCVNITYHA